MKLETILATKGATVVSASPPDSIASAVATLARHQIGALVVVDDLGRPVGIISERDIVRALATGADVMALSIKDLMTTTLVCGSPDDDLEPVLKTMTERRFRHLPVVEHGRLVGIVTIGDLVKVQLNQYRGAVDTLEVRLMESERAAS
jgi:CBS domain-containing protein